MDRTISLVAAVAATGFALDLVVDARRRTRPHVAAYAAGVTMFAIATWALAIGINTGWTETSYRIFYLFGTVLNVLFLAVGSMFLVVGRRSGHVALLIAGAISAMATTLVTTVPFSNPLPTSGIPQDVFGSTITFGPRLFAVIGGAFGGSTIIVLSLVSAFRFWNKDRRIVAGNALIVAGTIAASAGGTSVGFLDATSVFAISLFAAAALIWLGYRVTRGGRRKVVPLPTVVLAGPSIENPERAHAEIMISTLERAGYRIVCPARDIEDWGNVGYSPQEAIAHTFRAIDEARAVVVDLHHGYGVVAAGYAFARNVPVVMASPEGSRIPRPLRGVAAAEVYYRSADDVVRRLVEFVEPGTPVVAPDPASAAAR
jgi:MFS family permease